MILGSAPSPRVARSVPLVCALVFYGAAMVLLGLLFVLVFSRLSSYQFSLGIFADLLWLFLVAVALFVATFYLLYRGARPRLAKTGCYLLAIACLALGAVVALHRLAPATSGAVFFLLIYQGTMLFRERHNGEISAYDRKFISYCLLFLFVVFLTTLSFLLFCRAREALGWWKVIANLEKRGEHWHPPLSEEGRLLSAIQRWTPIPLVPLVDAVVGLSLLVILALRRRARKTFISETILGELLKKTRSLRAPPGRH